MYGVVDEQTPVHYMSIASPYGTVQTRIAELGFAPLLDPEQNPPGIPPGEFPRTSSEATSASVSLIVPEHPNTVFTPLTFVSTREDPRH